jgi:hypothetical protein
MSSESVCQVAHSWVDVGSFHTRLFIVFMIFTVSFLNILDIPSYLLTHSLTPHSTVLLEKLAHLQPVKKFPAFYGTWRFITTFTSACHLFLSWASSIQSIPPHPTSVTSTWPMWLTNSKRQPCFYPPQSRTQEDTQNWQTNWQTWWETCAVPESIQFSFSCSFFKHSQTAQFNVECVLGALSNCSCLYLTPDYFLLRCRMAG